MTETAPPRHPQTLAASWERIRRWWPGWRDATCLALLVTATFHLVFNDGGRPLRSLLPLLAWCAVAVVATFPTLKATPRWLRFIALAWVAGPLIALLFADVRAGWVRPVATWAIAVPIALATLHLLRRRWGSTAVLSIVGLALGLSWYEGLLVWLGGGTARGEPAWMAVSWHSQSGALMAVLGVGGLGIAVVRAGWRRAVGIVAAATGASGAWLSGSRGAAFCAAVAIIVVLALAARRSTGRELSVVAGATVVATTILVLILSPMWAVLGAPGGAGAGSPGITTQPIAAGDRDLTDDLRSRLGSWQAAVGMFASSPVTGTGPGSFAWSSRPSYPETAPLTNSPQSEQLGALGELGLVGGGAALALTFGLAWLVLASLRRPGNHDLEVAAAGVATLLAGHAALGFDWDYPILLALLAVAAAALIRSRDLLNGDPTTSTEPSPGPETAETDLDPDHAPRRDTVVTRGNVALTTATTVVALLLIAAGATGITLIVRGSMPWLLDDRIVAAVTSASQGERSTAEQHLDQAATWNPGAPRLPEVQALVSHSLGDLSDAQLAATIDAQNTAFADQLQAAGQLLEADNPQLVLEVIADVRPVLDRRIAWGVRGHVVHAAALQLSALHQLDGCPGVVEEVPAIERWLAGHDLQMSRLPDDGMPWADCDLPLRSTAS